MRLHYILASLTIATEFAQANNDFLSVNDIEDEILEEEFEDSEDEQHLHDDVLSELQEEEIMLGGPEKINYFKSKTYQRKSKEDKMKDLWGMLVPEEHKKFTQPAPLFWKE